MATILGRAVLWGLGAAGLVYTVDSTAEATAKAVKWGLIGGGVYLAYQHRRSIAGAFR